MLRVLTPSQLLDRLGSRLDLLAARNRDLPERQRTLRAALSWSFELLPDDEKRGFAGLAVFSDGFTLEAAEAALSYLDTDVVGLVGAFLDKSLVVRDFETAAEARFRMLDTVREFALEQLTASPDVEEASGGLVRWALSLTTTSGRAIRWVDAMATIDRFRAERANITAAMTWLSPCRRRSKTEHIPPVEN
jgi:predicted ATPase